MQRNVNWSSILLRQPQESLGVRGRRLSTRCRGIVPAPREEPPKDAFSANPTTSFVLSEESLNKLQSDDPNTATLEEGERGPYPELPLAALASPTRQPVEVPTSVYEYKIMCSDNMPRSSFAATLN